MEFVSPGAKSMTIARAMQDDAWVVVIRGSPSIPAVAEFLDLWELIGTQQLVDSDDVVSWKLTNSGVFSAKSAYAAFFAGRTRALAAEEL